jgi:hypothetical protein
MLAFVGNDLITHLIFIFLGEVIHLVLIYFCVFIIVWRYLITTN